VEPSYTFVDQPGPAPAFFWGLYGVPVGPDNPTNSWTHLAGGPFLPISPPFLEEINFGEPFTLSYDLMIAAQVDCYSGAVNSETFYCPIGGHGTISGDFVDPLTIKVLDANFNPVADATITSADGINYSGSGAVATPEPRQFWALAVLLVCFLWKQKKRAIDRAPRGRLAN
jgi:hypothetical protein